MILEILKFFGVGLSSIITVILIVAVAAVVMEFFETISSFGRKKIVVKCDCHQNMLATGEFVTGTTGKPINIPSDLNMKKEGSGN